MRISEICVPWFEDLVLVSLCALLVGCCIVSFLLCSIVQLRYVILTYAGQIHGFNHHQ